MAHTRFGVVSVERLTGEHFGINEEELSSARFSEFAAEGQLEAL